MFFREFLLLSPSFTGEIRQTPGAPRSFPFDLSSPHPDRPLKETFTNRLVRIINTHTNTEV